MRLMKSAAYLISQGEHEAGIFKHIENCARTCYKSEDKANSISVTTHFINKLISNQHLAMLEHGTLYLKVPFNVPDKDLMIKVAYNSYSRLVIQGPFYFITTNYRVIVELGATSLMKYSVEYIPEVFMRRITMKFITDRGVSHELVRHRVFSFAQESTRYCNYKGTIHFIIPHWCNLDEGNYITDRLGEFSIENINTGTIYKDYPYNDVNTNWLYLMSTIEYYYQQMSKTLPPQDARGILPNNLKTEICMTGYIDDWKHFFDLRLEGTTGKPHPDMLILAQKAKKELIDNHLYNEIESISK